MTAEAVDAVLVVYDGLTVLYNYSVLRTAFSAFTASYTVLDLYYRFRGGDFLN